MWLTFIQSVICFKYHVSCTDRKISVGIKIGITFILRFHRRPIQLCSLLWAFGRSYIFSRSVSKFSNKTCRAAITTKSLQERHNSMGRRWNLKIKVTPILILSRRYLQIAFIVSNLLSAVSGSRDMCSYRYPGFTGSNPAEYWLFLDLQIFSIRS